MRQLQEILGWERHTEIDYATGEEVVFYLPPVFVPVTDLYPRPSCDDLLVWLHINCPSFWSFGGKPAAYWGQIGFSVDLTFSGEETLFAALEKMVRYVDQYKEDLH